MTTLVSNWQLSGFQTVHQHELTSFIKLSLIKLVKAGEQKHNKL